MHQNVNSTKANEIGKFVYSLKDASTSNGNTFDSAGAKEFTKEVLSGRIAGAPEQLQILLDENKASSSDISRAILDSVSNYEKQHGVKPNNDLLHQVIHNAYATTKDAQQRYALDSASTVHHDQMGIQSARAIVAIVTTLGDAIPFAHYLPTDIGNNRAMLAIVNNKTANDYGSYAANGTLSGVSSGDAYITSSRIHRLSSSDKSNFAGKLTTIQGVAGDYDVCKQDATSIKVLRGRTIVYINGRIVAEEISSQGFGDSSISGKFLNGSVTHQISGVVNTDTGLVTLKLDPALPSDNFSVLVEGFIDYERSPELAPSIVTTVDTYNLYAKPWRVLTSQTIDSRTQMSNELGLDPYSQQVITVNAQFANERYYDVLRKAARLAVSNQSDYTFNMNPADALNSRLGLLHSISMVSQQMAVDTIGFGISVIYVNKSLAALFRALPSDIFVSSGIGERAGIYRLGTLFGTYDVYYTPKVVKEGQMLCIGRASDVARNPFVLGDAVPATVIPLAVGGDLKTGSGFYARNYTAVNPYEPSSKGCAMLNISFITTV